MVVVVKADIAFVQMMADIVAVFIIKRELSTLTLIHGWMSG